MPLSRRLAATRQVFGSSLIGAASPLRTWQRACSTRRSPVGAGAAADLHRVRARVSIDVDRRPRRCRARVGDMPQGPNARRGSAHRLRRRSDGVTPIRGDIEIATRTVAVDNGRPMPSTSVPQSRAAEFPMATGPGRRGPAQPGFDEDRDARTGHRDDAAGSATAIGGRIGAGPPEVGWASRSVRAVRPSSVHVPCDPRSAADAALHVCLGAKCARSYERQVGALSVGRKRHCPLARTARSR